MNKLTNKSRKATLLHVLAQIGDLPGIECHRTPGEDCALRIAMKVIERTPLETIDLYAHGLKDADVFWEKQW